VEFLEAASEVDTIWEEQLAVFPLADSITVLALDTRNEAVRIEREQNELKLAYLRRLGGFGDVLKRVEPWTAVENLSVYLDTMPVIR
jgi:hypothetical protein